MLVALALLVASTPVATPLVGSEGLALTGREPSATFPLGEFASRSAAGDMQFELQISGLIDVNRSAVAVLFDGVPLRASSLASLRPVNDQVHWKVSLPTAAKGFHQVVFRAQLEVFGGCESLTGHESWLTVLPESRWVKTSEPAHGLSVRDVVRQLQQRRPLRLEWVPPAGHQPTPEWVASYLELDRWVRDLGLSPQVAGYVGPHTSESASVFRLTVESPVKAKCDQGVTAVRAEVNGLRLTVEDPAQLALVVRALRSGAAEHCPAEICEFPSLVERLDEVNDDGAKPEPAEVASLGRLGFAQGWLARGEGVHELRFSVDRRPGWFIERAPRLELELTRSQGAQLDLTLSVIEVEVNGRPIGSWSLNQFQPDKPNLTAVELPASLWKANQWAVVVRASLRAPPDRPCRERRGSPQWVTLGPLSRLRVWRKEPTFRGLAAVVAGFATHQPKIYLKYLPTWVGLEALGGALYPIAQKHTTGWALAPDAASCGYCIRVVAATQMDTPVALWERARGGPVWRDVTGQSTLPLVEADPGVWVSTEAETPTTLTVHLPKGARRTGVVSPDYASLAETVAVYAVDHWVSAGPPTKPASWADIRASADAPASGHVLTREKKAKISFAQVTSLASLPILMGLIWWAIRARRLKPRERRA
jgi:hypothetical protein